MKPQTKLKAINALKKLPLLRTTYSWSKLHYYRRLQRSQFGKTDGKSFTLGRKEWEQNLDGELEGWEWLLDVVDFSERFNADYLMSPELGKVLDGYLDRTSIEAIDVGCGPISTLGRRYKNLEVHRTLADPLAHQYRPLMIKYGVEEASWPISCEGEKLTETFKPGTFDLVYMCNALDHCLDPLEVIRQMALLTAPKGVIYLEHFENEAEKEKFANLHKWNLFEENGDMIIANRTERHSFRKLLGPTFDVRAKPIYRHGGFVVATATKV